MGGFGMGVGWLFGLLMLAGVVALVVVGVRAARGGIGGGPIRSTPADRSAGARQILEERYARGELSTEEYQERRETLGGGS
ncbi:SHOCT domain-containing protein [Rhodococcus antarcticus]|jgi:putative membrane protein|uniref:SHOCT domain-containing protein n=1 Tax=Rhodococcus antarcticus TaxID=2987751 RepID=A0ABY6P5V3_9NOCA|nr:SHOCT domain-containing protein [Rhodococcus antarcticus]UZJ26736.1 SHOCT domain-containing protein [Rhodococcus antarcticus]